MSADAGRDRLALLVHELRSPVAALAAVSDALADGGPRPIPLRELVRLALAASRSATRIVRDAALGPLDRTDVDVEGLVHRAVTAARLEGGRLRGDVEAPLPRVSADEVRLRQALDNLVRNAVLHSGSDEEVVVSAHSDGIWLYIAVADSGRGISKGDQARIFEPGVRVGSSTSGSGMGLAIARSIAEAHGGTLDVESGLGPGATFTITLPLEDGPSAG